MLNNLNISTASSLQVINPFDSSTFILQKKWGIQKYKDISIYEVNVNTRNLLSVATWA